MRRRRGGSGFLVYRPLLEVGMRERNTRQAREVLVLSEERGELRRAPMQEDGPRRARTVMKTSAQVTRSWRQIAIGQLTRLAVLRAIALLKDPDVIDVWRAVNRGSTRRAMGTIEKHIHQLRRDGFVCYAKKRKSDPHYRNRFELVHRAARKRRP